MTATDTGAQEAMQADTPELASGGALAGVVVADFSRVLAAPRSPRSIVA